MHVLALNSRREFFASHRATREIVAEPALVLSAASQQTDFVVTPSGGEAGRGLPGMVPVAESSDGKLAPADGSEECLILRGPGPQGPYPMASPPYRSADRCDEVVDRLVHPEGGECFQIPFITCLADAGPLVEVSNPLAHPSPALFAVGLSLFCPEHLEVSCLVDRRLHPEHAPLLIVDLDGIGLELVFHPYPFGPLLVGADHFTNELAVRLFTEKAQNIHAPKGTDPAPHQGWVEGGKIAGRFEHEITRPLTLVGRPVVADAIREKHHFMGRVEPPGNGMQHLWPVRGELLVKKLLSCRYVLNPDKAVVPAFVAESDSIHLPGKPLPSIEADTDGEGIPRLDAAVHEAELLVDPVVVEEEALADARLQGNDLLLGVTMYLIGLAGFYRGQDGDECPPGRGQLHRATKWLTVLIFRPLTGKSKDKCSVSHLCGLCELCVR